MSKKAYEAQLAAIESLRNSADPASAAEPLRKALKNPNNYLVARAASVAAALGLRSLIPEMLAALDRFFVDAPKTDPQCWAKNALADALTSFDYGESEIFLRGLKHVQKEPVYGGSADTAGPLRARCAIALVNCRDLPDVRLLRHLVDLLVDPEKTVRSEAARAIGRIDRPESALLLRLRGLVGDPEPEVLGACFQSLLGIDRDLGFVSQFLDRDPEVAAEAALALGLTHEPEAFAMLKRRWEREHDPQLRAALLTGIALTRLQEAIDFLIGLVESDARGANDAVQALKSAALNDTDRARLQNAVKKRSS